MTMRLEGVKELEKALAEVAKQSTRVAIAQRALRRAAAPMLAKAKQYAPYDEGVLEGSIMIGTRIEGEVGRAAYARTMRATGGDKGAALSAMRTARREFRAVNPPAIMYLGPSTKAWYAHFVEFGTKDRYHKSGKYVGRVAPDPFMRPAFDSEAVPTVERLKPLIWDEIKRHADRMAKRAAKAAKG